MIYKYTLRTTFPINDDSESMSYDVFVTILRTHQQVQHVEGTHMLNFMEILNDDETTIDGNLYVSERNIVSFFEENE